MARNVLDGGDEAKARIRGPLPATGQARSWRQTAARQELEKAVSLVLKHAAQARRLDLCGTRELPATLTALASADCAESREAAARRTVCAFTASPKRLLGFHAGEELASCGAVIKLRAALAEFDEATQ